MTDTPLRRPARIAGNMAKTDRSLKASNNYYSS
jgi:hypothetical protein